MVKNKEGLIWDISGEGGKDGLPLYVSVLKVSEFNEMVDSLP